MHQVLNIDVLAIVYHYILTIIIEDEVIASEHVDQIRIYRGLLKFLFNSKNSINRFCMLEKVFKSIAFNVGYTNSADYHI